MTVHAYLINKCIEDGWSKTGFKKKLKSRLRLRPWFIPCDQSESECKEDGRLCEDCVPVNELVEALDEFHVLPDAYKIKIESGHPWSKPVLVVECLEVCVTNDLSYEKLCYYDNLWWAFDSSMRVHLRLIRMNRDGTTSTVIDKVPLMMTHHDQPALK